MNEKDMMNDWKDFYQRKLTTPAEAVKMVASGETVYIGTASGVAYELADALADRADELEDVTIASGLTLRPCKVFTDLRFRHITYFMGPLERYAYQKGVLDYSSIHLHEWETWVREIAHIDVVFLEVTPPDENGYVNLGTNGAGLGPVVLEQAKKVILSVNPHTVWCSGTDSVIPVSRADAIVESETMIQAIPEPDFDDNLSRLAGHIIAEIPDGATIQLGAGRIGTAIGYGLREKKDLGIHTEMISDSIMRLIQDGVVTNRKKTYYPGKTVIGFAMGSQKLYDFLDHNEDCIFLPLEIVNDPVNIAKNDNMISVNGAVEIDLYGQVSAETIRGIHHSGIGGQVDYVRGAQMSKGGKSIIATESTYGKGAKRGSRIVADLAPNSVVTTSAADVQYVATEYGCVNLNNKCMRDRALALISIAHPDFRDELLQAAKNKQII